MEADLQRARIPLYPRAMEAIVRETVGLINPQALLLGADDLESTDQETVVLHNIRADIQLAARALFLLLDVLLRLRDEHRIMFDEKASEDLRVAAVNRSTTLGLDFELHVRQIYELLYAIGVLIERLPAQSPKPTQQEMDELERLDRFRGALIVHKEGAVRFMRSSRIGNYERLDVRINVGLQPMREADAAMLGAIFSRTAPRLPPRLRAEENWNQQLQYLYEFLPRVSHTDKGQVVALIRRNGVQSDAPYTLARVVNDLAKRYFISSH